MLALTNFFINPLKSQKATRGTLLAIAWVAFLLRTMNLATQSLWRDEVDALRFSSWTFQELVAGLFRVGHNGPLFFLLLRPWRSLAGHSEFALRYPSALLGMLLIPLGFALTRQLGFSRQAGLLLGLLLATSPYLVWYGQEAKMYTLLVALITLATIAYLKALSSPSRLDGQPSTSGWSRRWWLLFGVTMSLAFYTHILAPLMLVVYGAIGLLHWPQLRQHWRGWLISMVCLTLPYFPLALWQVPLLLSGFQSGHPFYPLTEEVFLLLQLYSSGLIRFTGLTAIIVVVFLFLCGLFLEVQGHNKAAVISRHYSLAAWVLLPPLMVYLISLRVPVFEDRYLIYITPAFYLLVALGLMLLRQYGRWLASLCLGLMLAINFVGIWQQQRQPIKADFRAAAEYLARQTEAPAAIMIQTPYLQHTFNYYYRADYKLLEGLWTNNGKSEAMVDAEMSALTADLTGLWLVVSEEDLWDNRHLTRAWLNQNAELVDEAHFVRVDLYYYRLRPGAIKRQSLGTVIESRGR